MPVLTNLFVTFVTRSKKARLFVTFWTFVTSFVTCKTLVNTGKVTKVTKVTNIVVCPISVKTHTNSTRVYGPPAGVYFFGYLCYLAPLFGGERDA